jgi:hypothetical protein
MKKLLLFFLLQFSLFANGQTSVYHNFPESNAIWNINTNWYCWFPPYDYVDENYSITFGGDTLIGSQTYHKLVIPYFHINTTTCGAGITTINMYKGSIRQDTILKKVFIVPLDSISEVLLYDFTLNVGDTVKGYLEPLFPSDIVNSIDSIIVGSTYRKRWNINSGYNIHIIEGIGSTYGLIEQSPVGVTDQLPYSITCYSESGLTLYPNTATTCGIITSVNTINETSDEIKLYPNPATQNTTLLFNLKNAEEIKITLFDITGKEMMLIVNEEMQKGNQQININTSKLSPGIYICKIQSDNGERLMKLVVGK